VTYYYVRQGQPRYGNGTSRPQQQGYGAVNPQAPSAQFPVQQGFVPGQGQAGPSHGEVPPSYQQAIEGDHKVQRP
jgi:hypothetical protein